MRFGSSSSLPYADEGHALTAGSGNEFGVWADGLDRVHSLTAFQDAIIELRRSSVVKDGLSAVKESELVHLAQNFHLFIALHCEIRLRLLKDEYSITACSERTIVFFFFFFDMNTLMKSIILVHFTSPLIVNVSFLADI